MNRLTKKNDKKYFEENIACVEYNDYERFIKDRPYRINYLNTKVETKLGKLEDLEEQLGCPLEVFVNIMLGKITEIVVNYSDAAGYDSLYEELTLACVSGIIESINYPGFLCLETNLCEVPIKDYQKNWWLKGEKLNE